MVDYNWSSELIYLQFYMQLSFFHLHALINQIIRSQAPVTRMCFYAYVYLCVLFSTVFVADNLPAFLRSTDTGCIMVSVSSLIDTDTPWLQCNVYLVP